MKYWRRIFIPTLLVILLLLNGLILIQRQYINNYLSRDTAARFEREVSQQATAKANALSQFLYERFFVIHADGRYESYDQTIRNIIDKLYVKGKYTGMGIVIPDSETFVRNAVSELYAGDHIIEKGISVATYEKIVRDVIGALCDREVIRIEDDAIYEEVTVPPEELEQITGEIFSAELERLYAYEAEELHSFIQSYVSNQMYQGDGVYLRVYRTGSPDSGDGQTDPEKYVEFYRDDPLQKNAVKLEDLADGRVAIVKSIFDGTVGCAMRELQHRPEYKLVYIQSLEEPSWNRVLNIIQLFGLAASILVAVIMLLSMRGLTKPVSELTAATREFARGDHSQKLDPIGWDEVAELADLFNSMADETRRLELVEEDAQRKQRFLDSFTHELRTPLTNIYGYSELMKRVQLTEEDRLRYLDYMMHESRRLNLLSEELFNLTVLRESTTRMEPVSCAGLMDAVSQTLRAKAKRKGVSLEFERSGCTVRGNAALLESLCTNLCENAIRACGEGDTVRLSFRDEDGQVVLRVLDTGMGIAQDQLEHITEPFYRVDKARSRAEGGVGLGLYLCSEIVRIHGADMSFDSWVGEGTLVTVRFPNGSANETA